jgi:hypothetical protein
VETCGKGKEERVNIAVIGTGRIGTALATAWNQAGHGVTFGSRSGRAPIDGVLVAAPGDAAHAAEVVVFAIPGAALADTAAGLDLDGKLVIDCTNGGDTAQGTTVEMIAASAPAATIVKAFNTLGVENFRTPGFSGGRPDLLYVSSDDSRRESLETLISDVGLNPVRVGDLASTGVLDAATRFWFALAGVFGRHVGYSLLRDQH